MILQQKWSRCFIVCFLQFQLLPGYDDDCQLQKSIAVEVSSKKTFSMAEAASLRGLRILSCAWQMLSWRLARTSENRLRSWCIFSSPSYLLTTSSILARNSIVFETGSKNNRQQNICAFYLGPRTTRSVIPRNQQPQYSLSHKFIHLLQTPIIYFNKIREEEEATQFYKPITTLLFLFMSHSKQLNARTEKWRQMLNSDVHNDPSLLKKRVRKGVPACMRILVWPELIRMKQWKVQQKYTYESLIKQDSISDHDICLDVPRTFPEEKCEILRKSLYKVLRAICNVHPKVGYCQGMNFLTMRLLEVMENETSFWLLDYVFKNNPIILLNYRCPSSVEIQNYTFVKLMHRHLKDVIVRLESQNIIPLMYTTPWWITLFSNLLPKDYFYRIFECFLSEGYKIIYRAGLAIMKFKQAQILQNDLQGNISFVGDMSIFDNISVDDFVDAMFSFSLSKAEIHRYEEEYKANNQKSLKKSEVEADEGYLRRVQTYKKYEVVEEERKQQDVKLSLKEFSKLPFEYVTWSD